MATYANYTDLFLTIFIFEVIRSLPIARPRWVRVFRGISSPSFSPFVPDSRARQARRQIYGFSWQWRKRWVAGSSWRICQAAVDTGVHRFLGSKTAYPHWTIHICIYTYGKIFLTVYYGASFLQPVADEISKPNSKPTVVSSSSSRGKVRIYSRPGVSSAR